MLQTLTSRDSLDTMISPVGVMTGTSFRIILSSPLVIIPAKIIS